VIDPNKIRKKILTLAYKGQTAHVGCALSIVDILCVLYSEYPDDEIILSKGHGAMALYAIQHELKLISDHDIDSYFSNGSNLHGLVPGFGSLGHGLPVAVGKALAFKRQGLKKKVFCVVGDGEMQEGSNWEAIKFAFHHKLNNFCLIVDYNRWQAMGRTVDIVSESYIDLKNQLAHFGFDSERCEPRHVSLELKTTDWVFPKAIVVQTTKGAEVSFMEDKNEWHYRRLTEETYQKAMAELDAEDA
jgi:transketolase